MNNQVTAVEVADAAQNFGQEDDIGVITVARTAVLEPVSYKLNTSALLPRHSLSVSKLNFLFADHLHIEKRTQTLNGRPIVNSGKLRPLDPLALAWRALTR